MLARKPAPRSETTKAKKGRCRKSKRLALAPPKPREAHTEAQAARPGMSFDGPVKFHICTQMLCAGKVPVLCGQTAIFEALQLEYFKLDLD